MNDPGDRRTPRAFAILPAAGRSLRMGVPKLLLPWGDDGTTVIQHVLANWRSSRIDAVVVVVHPEDRELAEVCRRAGVDVAVASTPPPDMKASIRIGLEHLDVHRRPTADDLWLTAPADLPLLKITTIDLMLAAAMDHPGEILRPSHAGGFGHPVVWPWPVRTKVAELAENQGLNALFELLPWRAIEAPADCRAGDLDTPDDYRRLRPPHDR
ncbi:MAG: nucleotidyltransferase family protein [Pirellulales bacterium]